MYRYFFFLFHDNDETAIICEHGAPSSCIQKFINNHTYINLLQSVTIYIYIYIYTYCHPRTDYFAVSQLFSVARHVGRLKLGSKPARHYVKLSIKPLDQQAYQSAQFVRRACIMRAAAENSFTRVFNPHGGACTLSSKTNCFVVSQLFSVARNVGRLKLGSKPA